MWENGEEETDTEDGAPVGGLWLGAGLLRTKAWGTAALREQCKEEERENFGSIARDHAFPLWAHRCTREKT